MEALACATPVVAFNVGGIVDMIEHMINGYIAEYMNSEDLFKGLLWIIKNNDKKYFRYEWEKNGCRQILSRDSCQ